MSPNHEPVESPDATTIFSYHELTPPTTAEIQSARTRIEEHLQPTPLVRSPWLSECIDGDVYLKREDVFPIGAFKVRGGINLVAQLDATFHNPGLVAASTGNHGQSIAYAGREFDVPVMICVPEGANAKKVAAIERFGADVRFRGEEFDDAREYAEKLAIEEGYRYVHSANEPALIAGVGTAGLEIVEECPDLDFLISAVGGGSSAAGYCLTVGAVTDARVIGAQAGGAPAAYRAWREGTLDPLESIDTFAEGLATRVPFALTIDVLRDHLDDFVLYDDDALETAMGRMLEEERILIEGASAAAIATVLDRQADLRGKTVVVPISGRNAESGALTSIMCNG